MNYSQEQLNQLWGEFQSFVIKLFPYEQNNTSLNLTLSKQGIDHKPSKKEYGYRIKQMGQVEIPRSEIGELFNAIAKDGFSYKDALTDGTKKADFISQELLTLDFDSGISVERVLERCKTWGLHPNVIYHTFSHTAEHPRFRIIFFLQQRINALELAQSLRLSANYLFPDADQIKNPCQVYQGSNNGIYHLDTEQMTSIHDVILKACEEINRLDKKNYIRNLKSKLLLNADPRKSSKKCPSPLSIKGEGHKFEEKHTYEFASYGVQEDEPEEDKHFDWKKFEESCQLWRDSNNGTYWINNPQLFFFQSALKNKRGSRKRINSLIDMTARRHPEFYDSDAVKANKLRTKTATAMYRKCDAVCPFYEMCQRKSVETLKKGRVQRLLSSQEPISLQEGEKMLQECIKDSFESKKQVSIIKAPTGIGKTDAVLDYLKTYPHMTVCMAVPTHKLKSEIRERMIAKDIKGFDFIPELNTDDLEPELQESYLQYLRVGNYSEAKKLLYLSKNHDVMDYVRLSDNFNMGWLEKVVITHARTLLTGRLKHDVLIIDEDIILKSLNTMVVSINNLNDLKSKIQHPECDGWFSQWENEEGLLTIKPMKQKYIKEIIKTIDTSINFNVNQVLKSGLCFVENGQVYFAEKRRLLQCKKIVILSATIDDPIARKFFQINGMQMDYFEVPPVKYMGNLHQYTDLPSSKQTLSDGNLVEIYQKIMGLLPDRDMKMITYKSFEDELIREGFDVVATFGATEGLNQFAGEDIAIIGTFRVTPAMYMLFAKSIESTVEARDDKLSYQVTTYNGFRFHLYTFDHPIIREVNLYMINSEIEQCIGRARLVRKDCKVYLVCKLPMLQAQIENEI